MRRLVWWGIKVGTDDISRAGLRYSRVAGWSRIWALVVAARRNLGCRP
ncbi:MAG: hypothetical protein R3C32_11645 [Chloroflexota bacterium]